MNKHLNYSKKEDEDNLKNNNKTISTNSKKVKSIQLSREHLNKIYNSSHHQKNKLEKKLKVKIIVIKQITILKNQMIQKIKNYHLHIIIIVIII